MRPITQLFLKISFLVVSLSCAHKVQTFKISQRLVAVEFKKGFFHLKSQQSEALLARENEKYLLIGTFSNHDVTNDFIKYLKRKNLEKLFVLNLDSKNAIQSNSILKHLNAQVLSSKKIYDEILKSKNLDALPSKVLNLDYAQLEIHNQDIHIWFRPNPNELEKGVAKVIEFDDEFIEVKQDLKARKFILLGTKKTISVYFKALKSHPKNSISHDNVSYRATHHNYIEQYFQYIIQRISQTH